MKRVTFDDEEQDYLVLAVHYMSSWHPVRAVSPEKATAKIDLPGSLCHQCSDDYDYDSVADIRVLHRETEEQLYSCGFITDEKEELEKIKKVARRVLLLCNVNDKEGIKVWAELRDLVGSCAE